METNYGFQIKPIPDETFFGMLVTIGILSGYETYIQLYSRILGNDNLCPQTLLPRGLQKIAGFLPQRYRDNVESLCLEHTALQYFQRFSRPEGLLRAKEIMWRGSEGNVRCAVGVTSTSIRESRQFKFCSACADEQQKVYGRTTWLRSHQLPGVDVCFRHGLSLIESPIAAFKYGTHSSQIQLPSLSGNKHTTPKVWSAGDAWDCASPNRLIAQISHELLIRQPAFTGPKFLGKSYRSALISAGYCKGRYLDSAKIEVALRERYGDLIPRRLGLDFFCKSYGHWVHRITSSQDTVLHPLQHILIIGLLFDNYDQFDSATVSSKTAPNFDEQEFEFHRKALQEFVNKNPQLTRTEIKRRMRRRYQWLLIHDREWLQSVLPPKAVKGRNLPTQRRKTDWDSLDRKLEAAVLRANAEDAKRIFDCKHGINRAQVARLSEFSYVQVTKLVTFPRTIAALDHLRGLYSGYAAR